MKRVTKNHHLSPAGSAGRTDALKRIPRTAGAELGSPMVRLDWAGREEAARLADSPPRGELRKVHELSTGEGRSGNAIIHADNLSAMAALTPALCGRVDLAFLDPPYNAARERWTYPDRILGWFGSVVGAEGEDPLRHDKWLSMMYPRLALLRVLLAESGTLFMTLDDHEVHHARVLMDEIFGPENFLANITWEKTQTPEDTGAPFRENHTHVLVYAANAKSWRPNPSAVKAPTIWRAADLGTAREAQTVDLSSPGAPYPLIPKPVGLLRRILRIAAGPDALVLDPFAGSGTTAQAVLEQNTSDGGHRKFVLVEADDRARTLIPRCLAEVPGAPPGYDFYTLASDRASHSPASGERKFRRARKSRGQGSQEAACSSSSSAGAVHGEPLLHEALNGHQRSETTHALSQGSALC
jgi:DNA modification methylase